MILYDCLSVFHLILVHFLLLSSDGKSFRSFVYVLIHCVGAGTSTLMSVSDGLDRYIFRRKMENTRSLKWEMDGKVFISRQSRHISFVIIMNKVLFRTLYLDLACKHLCFPPRKRYIKEKWKYYGKIRNITLITSWLYWLRLVDYSKESNFLL